MITRGFSFEVGEVGSVGRSGHIAKIEMSPEDGKGKEGQGMYH